MFAGKSSSMLSDIERHRIARMKCVVVRHSVDDRYGNTGHIITHDGRAHDRLAYITAAALADIETALGEYDAIGIDEVQFFPDSVEVVSRLAALGKIVICAGIDATWQRKPFARMGELAAISEYVIKLNAVCLTCGGVASFTRKNAGSTAELEVGGAELYSPSCRGCF